MSVPHLDAWRRYLTAMEIAFRRFERCVPPPLPVQQTTGFRYQYIERSRDQALVQKFARVISGLHAVELLAGHGFTQEQGALVRLIDEINEDIVFLASAPRDELTPLHDRYLRAFNSEQSAENPDLSVEPKGPDSPPRREIRKHNARVLGMGVPKTHAGATLYKAYSGYVHAASQNVMEMYGGTPARFHLRGLAGSPHAWSHGRDAWNYLYRGFLSAMFCAEAFGDADALLILQTHLVALDAQMETLIADQPPKHELPGS